jgi:hypothetical protein
VTILAAVFLIAGVGLVGLGQRLASMHPTAPQVLGGGVVMFFGGIALISFRSGDRTPVVILATVGLLLFAFGVAALRGLMRPGSADRRAER